MTRSVVGGHGGGARYQVPVHVFSVRDLFIANAFCEVTPYSKRNEVPFGCG